VSPVERIYHELFVSEDGCIDKHIFCDCKGTVVLTDFDLENIHR